MASETQYEANFSFPWRDLENDRVKVVLFNPAVHGAEYWAGTKDHPEVYDYLPWGPFPSLDSFVHYIDQRFNISPSYLVLAVLDKTSPGTPLAGLVGFLYAEPSNLSLEVGILICLPAFQRRRITYAAVALLLQYSLNLPTDGGLGLRRVQYQANSNNVKSVGFAKKMGFHLEGIIRWQRVLDGSKPGNEKAAREGDPKPGTVGRDTALLSLCWDDWEEGKKDAICQPEYVLYRS
ncbi:acyl-CoA N-acyltransferase [Dichomitus squalens]|uniref:Acyl-CoA N-acyltransferase n=1 Tax=Dichomitus squalens TaxID=114155 RepID=A0A4Q9P0C0_9APHY|nr:acyl-CoA N-acyltransferase [Dichomitus squalens]TBU60308.1 acyl-CoA N-acyltransferase [Dichomitus squalens]